MKSGYFWCKILIVAWYFESTWSSFIILFLITVISSQYHWFTFSVLELLCEQLYNIYRAIFQSHCLFSLSKIMICTQQSLFTQKIFFYTLDWSSQATIFKSWPHNHSLYLSCKFHPFSQWQHVWFLWQRSLSSVSCWSVKTLSRFSWCDSSAFSWWHTSDK